MFMFIHHPAPWASQVALGVKNSLANTGDVRDSGSVPGSGRPLEKEMATHFSILAWKMPWTEEPGRLHPWGGKELDKTEHAHTHTLP